MTDFSTIDKIDSIFLAEASLYIYLTENHFPLFLSEVPKFIGGNAHEVSVYYC